MTLLNVDHAVTIIGTRFDVTNDVIVGRAQCWKFLFARLRALARAVKTFADHCEQPKIML